jgi:hypothetical protein
MFARTETFMPMKPAAALAAAPTRKPPAYHQLSAVLPPQEGGRPCLDRSRHLDGLLVGRRGREDPAVEEARHEEGERCGDEGNGVDHRNLPGAGGRDGPREGRTGPIEAAAL